MCELKISKSGDLVAPSASFMKINIDGSSRGNSGPTGNGRISRDSSGLVVFIFLANEGIQTINRMEGLAILYALK